MGARIISNKTPIMSENITLRLKADGGAVLVDDNGQEDTFFILGKKVRTGIDEDARDRETRAKFEGFEVEFLVDSLPITIQTVIGDGIGGSVSPSYGYTNDSTKNWPQLIEYLLKSLWLDMKIGQTDLFSTLLGSDNKEIDLSIDSATEYFKISVVNERLGDTFYYNELFAQVIDESITNDASGAPVFSEKVIENTDDEGEISDLDLVFRISFFGSEDRQVANG